MIPKFCVKNYFGGVSTITTSNRSPVGQNARVPSTWKSRHARIFFRSLPSRNPTLLLGS